MKYRHFYILILLAFSCNEKKSKEFFMQKSAKNISIINDLVFMNKEKFNGTLFELNQNKKDTVLIEQYKDGLLNGTCKKWYLNNQLMECREYTLGKKNGKQIAYWENGKKRFEFIAKDDAYQGEMKEWSINGNLFHLANFVNGQEEGTQKMWYENGKIRANYVIIKGKRYGLLGTKNCKNASDSIFIVK
jgi:antitoxin component YwqK of YwqJK toxin-antitoxin module